MPVTAAGYRTIRLTRGGGDGQNSDPHIRPKCLKVNTARSRSCACTGMGRCMLLVSYRGRTVKKFPLAMILDRRGYYVSNKDFPLMKYPEPWCELPLTRDPPLLQCEMVAQLNRSHTSRTGRDRRRRHLWRARPVDTCPMGATYPAYPSHAGQT